MNFVHQVGDQPKLYYDARSTNHQDPFHWMYNLMMACLRPKHVVVSCYHRLIYIYIYIIFYFYLNLTVVKRTYS